MANALHIKSISILQPSGCRYVLLNPTADKLAELASVRDLVNGLKVEICSARERLITWRDALEGMRGRVAIWRSCRDLRSSFLAGKGTAI